MVVGSRRSDAGVIPATTSAGVDRLRSTKVMVRTPTAAGSDAPDAAAVDATGVRRTVSAAIAHRRRNIPTR
jgi:hypothetical protein